MTFVQPLRHAVVRGIRISPDFFRTHTVTVDVEVATDVPAVSDDELPAADTATAPVAASTNAAVVAMIFCAADIADMLHPR